MEADQKAQNAMHLSYEEIFVRTGTAFFSSLAFLHSPYYNIARE